MPLHCRRILLRCTTVLAFAATCAPAFAYDWTQYNFDSRKSGNNTLERTIHRNNVGQLVQKWQVSTPGNQHASAAEDEKWERRLAIAAAAGMSSLDVASGRSPSDGGDYQLHDTMINPSTGRLKVFNVACSDVTNHAPRNEPSCTVHEGAVWARPGV